MEKELFSLYISILRAYSILKSKFFPFKNLYDFSEIVELPIMWAKNGIRAKFYFF